MDMEKVLVVENLNTIEDVEQVAKRAKEENYEYYVGISTKGSRFGIVDGSVKKLGEDEFARNEFYVAPEVNSLDIEEEPIEEEVAVEPVAEEEPVVEPVEEKIEETEVQEEPVLNDTPELTDEEREEMNFKLAQFDIIVTRNQELETRNDELLAETAKLNSQIDELTMKLSLAECQVVPVHETDFDDVYEFLKSHKITSVTIDKE